MLLILDQRVECKTTRVGREYMGNQSATVSGDTCLSWETLNSPLVARLPDVSSKAAKNFCRYIPGSNWQGPSCFIRTQSDVVIAMICDIPFCGMYFLYKVQSNSFTSDL